MIAKLSHYRKESAAVASVPSIVRGRRLSRRASHLKRLGIASVEFAVVFPILMILVLGTVEVCQRLFIRQSATIAAYEGIRLAARKTSSAEDVVSRCKQLLEDRRVSNPTIN